MEVKNIKKFGFIALIAGTMMSCVSDNNSPGLEFMPDMYRSSAVEAYWDYAEVRGEYSEEAYNLIREKFSFLPPAGSIPYAGVDADITDMPYEHGAPINADRTHGLFGMRQDSLGRENAKTDPNPIEFSEDVLEEGKVLYERFCIHCHGESGAGDGTVPNTGKFPPPGAYSGTLKDLTPGEIFYTITYGKGQMGSHASQLNKKERWKVVYYVQTLQGYDLGVVSDSLNGSMNADQFDEDGNPIIPEDNGGN